MNHFILLAPLHHGVSGVDRQHRRPAPGRRALKKEKLMPKKQTAPVLPSFRSYGPYSGNYGTHALRFTDAQNNTFWFSYQTLVAFRHSHGDIVVHKNDWGPTTGKHLNAIDDNKKNRLSSASVEFSQRFIKEFGRAAP